LTQNFTARMPLLMAASAFGLGIRRCSSPQQCYLHCLCTSWYLLTKCQNKHNSLSCSTAETASAASANHYRNVRRTAMWLLSYQQPPNILDLNSVITKRGCISATCVWNTSWFQRPVKPLDRYFECDYEQTLSSLWLIWNHVCMLLVMDIWTHAVKWTFIYMLH